MSATSIARLGLEETRAGCRNGFKQLGRSLVIASQNKFADLLHYQFGIAPAPALPANGSEAHVPVVLTRLRTKSAKQANAFREPLGKVSCKQAHSEECIKGRL